MTENEREPELEEYDEIEEVDDAVIGVALKRSGWVLLVILLILAVAYLILREKPAEEKVVTRENIEAPKELDQETPDRKAVRFEAMKTGVTFTHFNGATGEKLLPETMGSGVAVFDYDNDGDQDLFFANGQSWPHERKGEQPTQALYRNDGTGQFEDVTKASGLAVSAYAMGVAVGDVDGDGDRDLFLANLGENQLFLNQNGRFEEVTKKWRLTGDKGAWSTSAGFFDYDGDGDLDLFVCNYVTWNRQIDLDLNFTLNGTDRAYGPPKQYPGTHNYLYRNDGGQFTDVSAEAGIQVTNKATGEPMGKALAVTFADPDQDGRLDIFVANDTVGNFAFHNQGDGTFSEEGDVSGLAFDNMGAATGAMGMDAAYYSEDERLAVSIANFSTEATSFYVQQPGSSWQFADMTNTLGVGSPSRLKLSFGLYFFDYDLDGRLDLFQANGHLEEEINAIQPSQHYRQAPQIFWNTGARRGARFAVVPDEEVGDLAEEIVGRGAAYGDFDGDGDLDVVVTDSGGPARLYRNQQQLGHHWLRVKLVGKGNTDAIGALVTLKQGDKTQRQRVMPTRSYLSQVELPITFGLGEKATVDELTVHWPDGQTQKYPVDTIDTTLTLSQE